MYTNLLETAEIRWFLPGEIPEKMRAWFNGFDDFPPSSQTRTDHYLHLPGNAIGIKIREGLIEHKQGVDGVGEKWRSGTHSGKVEHWQKWSFPLDDYFAIAEMLNTYTGSWLSIIKERQMRILSLDPTNRVLSTSYEEVSGTAVGWELTKLKIEGSNDSRWTMGFESFGNDNKLTETLIKICNTILADCPLKLTEEDCYSYPELMCRV